MLEYFKILKYCFIGSFKAFALPVAIGMTGMYLQFKYNRSILPIVFIGLFLLYTITVLNTYRHFTQRIPTECKGKVYIGHIHSHLLVSVPLIITEVDKTVVAHTSNISILDLDIDFDQIPSNRIVRFKMGKNKGQIFQIR